MSLVISMALTIKAVILIEHFKVTFNENYFSWVIWLITYMFLFYSRCVYFDTSVKEWVSPSGVCSVNNNLEDGQDDYVDCSCKHLTHYAVKANALDPGLAGYPTAFYVASFICMVSAGGRIYNYYTQFPDWLIDWWFDWLHYQPKSKSYCP